MFPVGRRKRARENDAAAAAEQTGRQKARDHLRFVPGTEKAEKAPPRFLGTPLDLFAKLDAEFGFTVDASSSHENALCERHWTAEEDGLKQDWTGEVVWCNPMYDRHIVEWVQKAIDAPRCTTCLLLPVSTDTKWWSLVWDHERHQARPNCQIRFMPKRLKFRPAQKPAAFATVVIVVRNP